MIWGLVKTYYYQFWGNNHPLTSYYRVPRVPGFRLKSIYILISHDFRGRWTVADSQKSRSSVSRPLINISALMFSVRAGEVGSQAFDGDIGCTTTGIEFGCGYGSIPINTIFRGMNIHLPAILMWTTGVQGFDTLPCSGNMVIHGKEGYVYIYITNMIWWPGSHEYPWE